jgi:hypothetical protein
LTDDLLEKPIKIGGIGIDWTQYAKEIGELLDTDDDKVQRLIENE